MEFDPHHKKWECCCCHVTSGVQILAGMEILLGGIGIAVFATGSYGSSAWLSPYIGVVLIIDLVLCIIATVLLIVAVRIVKAKLAVPHFAIHAVSIVVILGMAIFHIILATEEGQSDEISAEEVEEEKKEKQKNDAQFTVIFTIILTALAIFGLIYAIYLVQRIYVYLIGLRKHTDRRVSRLQIAVESGSAIEKESSRRSSRF